MECRGCLVCSSLARLVTPRYRDATIELSGVVARGKRSAPARVVRSGAEVDHVPMECRGCLVCSSLARLVTPLYRDATIELSGVVARGKRSAPARVVRSGAEVDHVPMECRGCLVCSFLARLVTPRYRDATIELSGVVARGKRSAPARVVRSGAELELIMCPWSAAGASFARPSQDSLHRATGMQPLNSVVL